MKHYLFLALFVCLSAPLFAQPLSGCLEPTKKTLFGSSGPKYHPSVHKEKTIRVYVEGAIAANSLAEQAVPNLQLGAGLVYKNRVSAGLLYGSSLRNFSSPADGVNNLNYRFQYYGGEAQVTFFPDRKFSLSIPMQLAIGSTTRNTLEGNRIVSRERGDRSGLIIPGIKGEANLTDRLKLGLGLNYRAAVRSDFLPNSEVSGWNGQLLLRYTFR